MVTTKDMVQVIRVLTLHVLATTDDFMSVDRKAFKTAVWKEQFIGYMIAFTMFPSSLSAEINKIHCCGGGIINHTSLP